MARGWAKPKQVAGYAGVSERTMRKWLKDGLKFSQLPTGTILVRYEWVDEYLNSFESDQDLLNDLVNKVCTEISAN